jgi:hypothetical protein
MIRIGKILFLAALLTAPAVSLAQGEDPELRSSQNEPAAVEIPLYAGATVKSVLDALNAKGFKIKYNPEQVLPTMTLLERPKATRIDMLLNEILSPYDLHASQIVHGGWAVKAKKKKKPKP